MDIHGKALFAIVICLILCNTPIQNFYHLSYRFTTFFSLLFIFLSCVSLIQSRHTCTRLPFTTLTTEFITGVQIRPSIMCSECQYQVLNQDLHIGRDATTVICVAHAPKYGKYEHDSSKLNCFSLFFKSSYCY